MSNDRLFDYIQKIEAALKCYIPKDNGVVCEAMEYSLNAGGKRIRPVLTLEFCRLCGGDVKKAVPFACAVEMIHTYSLIHDDLPCMDDDDMRRGRPSCHKQFGEAYALLAGDALLTYAFGTLLCAAVDDSLKVKAGCLLSEAAGFGGMIGGQMLDLQNENKESGADAGDGEKITVEMLEKTDSLKTGALIKAACALGCIAAGADDRKIAAACEYAQKLGLAFQIVDDILDVTADEKLFGKPVGSDIGQGKSTYVSHYGLDEAKRIALSTTQQAKAALDIFAEDAIWLRELADSLVSRKF